MSFDCVWRFIFDIRDCLGKEQLHFSFECLEFFLKVSFYLLLSDSGFDSWLSNCIRQFTLHLIAHILSFWEIFNHGGKFFCCSDFHTLGDGCWLGFKDCPNNLWENGHIFLTSCNIGNVDKNITRVPFMWDTDIVSSVTFKKLFQWNWFMIFGTINDDFQAFDALLTLLELTDEASQEVDGLTVLKSCHYRNIYIWLFEQFHHGLRVINIL